MTSDPINGSYKKESRQMKAVFNFLGQEEIVVRSANYGSKRVVFEAQRVPGEPRIEIEFSKSEARSLGSALMHAAAEA